VHVLLSPLYFSWWHWLFWYYCFTIWKLYLWCYLSIWTELYIQSTTW